MPTIVEEGRFKFFIYPLENSYEPPHVHVWIGNDDVCRLDLNTGLYLDNPPPGEHRAILTAYKKYAILIRREWDRIHGR